MRKRILNGQRNSFNTKHAVPDQCSYFSVIGFSSPSAEKTLCFDLPLSTFCRMYENIHPYNSYWAQTRFQRFQMYPN